ncbi:MAG TPA: DUF3656 domain-containing protein, partial [Verrucomicrobiae bacterium]|nr:DUF3656 domain-containing protein [Verrucomicrobiae bacterium]
IVQDLGVCRLIRRLSPDFPIHASTQMTITSAVGVEFARELGCSLVVLARECSLREISAIRQARAGSTSGGAVSPRAGATAATSDGSLPLEVFVHGALCVAYSGQCLTSEALGGRSANRGECAQACRLPYDLISDGQLVPLGDRKYLLSPQDLAGLEVLPELIGAGVTSLKIEGRLKSPEYVANITRIYRQALDQLCGGSELSRPAAGRSASATAAAADHDRYDMEMAFSRGLYTGWFRGINNQKLVHARFGKKRGVYLGQVVRVQEEGVVLCPEAPVKPGDGVVFDAGHPEQPEQGGRIYQVTPAGSLARFDRGRSGALTQEREVMLQFGRGDLNLRQVHPGDRVWKTSDPELDRRLRQSFAQPRFQRPVDFEVQGALGQPLTLIVRDEFGTMVRLQSALALTAAERQPLSEERLRAQLGRLGGTPFRLGRLINHIQDRVILPLSELNRLRREATAQLLQRRSELRRWTLTDSQDVSVTETMSAARQPVSEDKGGRDPQLIALVRSLPQLSTVLEGGLKTIYCELEDPKKYREAVTMVRATGGAGAGAPTIWVAPPRIFKPGEEWILKQVRSCEADGYLVRNYDQLCFFAGCRQVGDFSFNVANRLSAEWLMERSGLERVTASYDLNGAQLMALLEATPRDWFEVTIHQHMPMFHMEHCVFCAFLSSGTDYTNCGRPCDRQQVRLRDRVGAEHVLKADAGCRNTVFNALAQTGAELVGQLLALGTRHFRLEFVQESAEQVRRTVDCYRQLLRKQISGAELWRELKLVNQLGVTRGSLERR